MEKDVNIRPERIGLWTALKELFGANGDIQDMSKEEAQEIERLYRETKNVKKIEEEISGELVKKKNGSNAGSGLSKLKVSVEMPKQKNSKSKLATEKEEDLIK